MWNFLSLNERSGRGNKHDRTVTQKVSPHYHAQYFPNVIVLSNMSGSSTNADYCNDYSWCRYWYERSSHGKGFANAYSGGKSGSNGAIAGVVCQGDHVRCPLRRARNPTLTNTNGNEDLSGRTAWKKDTMQDIAPSRKEFARRIDIYELEADSAA